MVCFHCLRVLDFIWLVSISQQQKLNQTPDTKSMGESRIRHQLCCFLNCFWDIKISSSFVIKFLLYFNNSKSLICCYFIRYIWWKAVQMDKLQNKTFHAICMFESYNRETHIFLLHLSNMTAVWLPVHQALFYSMFFLFLWDLVDKINTDILK